MREESMRAMLTTIGTKQKPIAFTNSDIKED